MLLGRLKMLEEILKYWFSDAVKPYWFSSTTELDTEMKDKFLTLWEQTKAGEKNHWKDSADGCLALCIVLDQLPLNMFRDNPKSFSTEQQAIEITKVAIQDELDIKIDNDQVSFLYMPLMHSEKLADQNLSVVCFEKAKLEGNIRFAKHHRDIIEQFGRFPHRNKILGRESTQKELDYLASDRAFTG
jgi:uncharacterized protein (DUF924 family)